MKIYWQCVYWWDGCKIMIPRWLETSFDIFSYSLVWYFHAITHHVVLLRTDNSLGFLLFLFFLIQSLLILFKVDEFFIWSEEKPEYWADESLKFHGTSLVVQRLGLVLSLPMAWYASSLPKELVHRGNVSPCMHAWTRWSKRKFES